VATSRTRLDVAHAIEVAKRYLVRSMQYADDCKSMFCSNDFPCESKMLGARESQPSVMEFF